MQTFSLKTCQHRRGCETNSDRHRMVTRWNQFVEVLTRPGCVWAFEEIFFFTNLSDSCWMQQHCVTSGRGQITKITFYSYPGGNSPMPFLRQTTLIYSLQQFSCTHLSRKTPRRHLEDHLPLMRNQHCWLSFRMTHAWLGSVSSGLSNMGVDNN